MRIYNINGKEIKLAQFDTKYADGRKCTDENGSFCQDSCGKCPSNNYYIKNKIGLTFLSEHDYVIINDDDTVTPLSKELFDLFIEGNEFTEIKEKPTFSLNTKTEIEDKETLEQYLKFLKESLNLDIENVYIKEFKEMNNAFNEKVNRVVLEIVTPNSSILNIQKITDLIKYLDKYTNLILPKDDISISVCSK